MKIRPPLIGTEFLLTNDLCGKNFLSIKKLGIIFLLAVDLEKYWVLLSIILGINLNTYSLSWLYLDGLSVK